MGRTRNIRAGFTVTELLVVIAIIALLIAILLPALNKARRQAQRTACLSKLQHLGSALFVYASDGRGSFPMAGGPGFSSPWMSFGLHPPTMYYEDWSGLGLLYGGRYVRDAHVFYCPDAPTDNWDPLTYDNHWYLPPESASWSLSSYCYRILEEGAPPQPRGFVMGKKGASTTSILADMQLRRPDFTNHREGSNVWYGDGHAKWVEHAEGMWDYQQWWVQPLAAWEYFDRQ